MIITDSIQAILLTFGSAAAGIIAYNEIGSCSVIQQQIGREFLSLIRPVDDALIPWPTLLVSLPPILGFYFMCSNQYLVQRVLGARSIDDGRKGRYSGGCAKAPAPLYYGHL